MVFESIKPTPTPNKVEAVNYETFFPEISPILFLLASYRFILALDAADNRKQILLATFAIEANARK